MPERRGRRIVLGHVGWPRAAKLKDAEKILCQ
jgi:hypothetical protein